MSDILDSLPHVATAFTIYLVAVVSPGPANIAIISTAINQGRKRAILFALGVFAGSFTWAMSAALGLSAILARYGEVLYVIKILGGLYLLYLALKCCRGALKGQTAPPKAQRVLRSRGRTFLSGYGLHLTNPKAIFGWIATISVGLPPQASPGTVALVVTGCLSIGFVVFLGYALMFSTNRAARLYQSARRPLDALLALLFGAAGIKMMTSSL
ncbi:LysE family translocator [Rhizobium sp. SGZ-381]|uniref:LysE family translocator n=1 Tax=Rhizobium sp. SGZ-381 TaxID=3342800 RepID=UPI0036701DC3